MADYLIKGETLSGIADAIRSKTGSSAPVAVSSMASQIAGITGGGGSDVTLLENLPFELDFASGDMSFEAPNGYAVKSAVVKKPAALIPANIKSGVEVAGIVGTFEGSGGGANPDANDPVYYVTFMNGDQVLYVRPVVSGDTCPDVVSKGWIEKPTKEPTEQYTYYYNGWSDTDGGSANSSILQNISSDKTVYAVFGSSARTYTITYLDDDGVTVLKTQSASYGSTPSYEPVKLGYAFVSWTPAIVPVTGDATYTVVWKVQHPEEEEGYVLVLPTTAVTLTTYNQTRVRSELIEIYEPLELGATYKITWAGNARTEVCSSYAVKVAQYATQDVQATYYAQGVGNPHQWRCSAAQYTTVKEITQDGTKLTDNYKDGFFEKCATDETTGKHYLRVYYKYGSAGTYNVKLQRVL